MRPGRNVIAFAIKLHESTISTIPVRRSEAILHKSDIGAGFFHEAAMPCKAAGPYRNLCLKLAVAGQLLRNLTIVLSNQRRPNRMKALFWCVFATGRVTASLVHWLRFYAAQFQSRFDLPTRHALNLDLPGTSDGSFAPVHWRRDIRRTRHHFPPDVGHPLPAMHLALWFSFFPADSRIGQHLQDW